MKLTYFTYKLMLLVFAEMVMGSCDTKLECSLLSDLLEMAMKQKSPGNGCQCPSRKNIPAFSSVLTKSQSLGAKDVIKFDKVVTNNGNGYNPITGIFTAPIAGVYQFSYTVMSDTGKYLAVYLSHNNKKQQSIWLKDTTHDTGSNNIILNLQKGDKVKVKSHGNYTIYSDGNLYSSFSGYLIGQ
ncbi:complement C1q-like protein 3 [Mytilus californianus]|uniref:complement C1q-like protein 3 n=1 Tax=Mytilus californianus TaxID=6549 RepID=UPI0022477BB3|nr:complement C1q-like protein 3 [Mytilus californianus]